MPTLAIRTLHGAIHDRVFDRAYYMVGDDDFQKEAAVRDIRAGAVESSLSVFNCQVLRGTETAADVLDTALNTLPLLTERRLVILRDVHSLRKDARAALLKYLQHAASDTVLVLTAAAGEKVDKVLAELTQTVDFPAPRGDELSGWIGEHIRRNLGAAITPAATARLEEAFGADLVQLAAELEKLANFAAGREIDEDAVAEVAGARAGETMGDLLDAVAQRDARRASNIVDRVLAQSKSSAVAVILALATQAMAIAWGRAARDGGLAAGRMEREFFALLRESKVFPGRPWGEAVASWVRAVGSWNTEDSREAVRLLALADAAAKESRVSSDEQLIRTLVLSLCAAGRRRAA